MRVITIAAVAAAFVASPALANEARIEARGGIYWTHGYDQAVAGVAAGYDWDLGTGAFAGVEASADKILDGGTRVSVGGSVRAGANIGDGFKAYAVGGYNTKPCRFCDEAWSIGGGLQAPIAERAYGKLEYRRYLPSDPFPESNAVVAGIGFRF